MLKNIPITAGTTDEDGRTIAVKQLLPARPLESVLYVGASAPRHDYLELFPHADILEIDPESVSGMATFMNKVMQGDITTFVPEHHYDMIFWWHGPEHVTKELSVLTINRLKKYCNMLIVGTPWGYSPHPGHVSEWDVQDMVDLNMLVTTIGEKNQYGQVVGQASGLAGYWDERIQEDVDKHPGYVPNNAK